MRDPRPGTGWSRQRIALRAAYGCWIASPQWLQVRRLWYREWLRRYGREPTCAVCGRERSLTGGDLHHRSYRRLGQEHFEDLIPVDRNCHDRVHELWDANPFWRRIDRGLANDLIIGILHQAASRHANP